MSDASNAVKMQFDDLSQQREADTLGMWVFLATELLLFSGVFLAYTVYRIYYPQAFMEAGQHLDLVLGSINTAILLTSAFTFSLALPAVQAKKRTQLLVWLSITALLGIVFLVIKGIEYAKEIHEGLAPLPGLNFHFPGPHPEHAQLFFNLYYILTGMHALHLFIGICIAFVMIVFAARSQNFESLEIKIDIASLYWHFIDVVWVFIFSMLYLMNR